MAKNDIDNINAQIEKLKDIKNDTLKNNKKAETKKSSKMVKTTTIEYVRDDISDVEKAKDEITKEFKKIENTDTKIFDGKSENIEHNQDNSIEDTKENVVVFERASDEDGCVDNEHEMSNTFVEDKSKFVKKRKMKKNVKIIIILSILIVLISILLGVVIFSVDSNEQKEIKYERKLTEKEKEKIIKDFGSSLEKVISEELNVSENLLEYDESLKLINNKSNVKCGVHEIYDDGKIYLNKCSIKGVMTKYSYGEEKVITDNTVKVYVEKSSGVATLIKPSASIEPLYEIHNVDCGTVYSKPFLISDKLNYLAYSDLNGKLQIKNFMTDEKILKNINYSEILPIKHKEGLFDSINVFVKVNGFWGIYNYSGEQNISPMYSSILSGVNELSNDTQYAEVISENLIGVSDGKNYGIIDYNSNRSIVPFEYKKFDILERYIYAYDQNNNITMYDTTGKKYFAGYSVIGNLDFIHYILKKDSNIYFADFNGKILFDYGIINNMGMVYNSKNKDSEIIFNFVDEDTTDKCVTIIYNYNNGKGTYTRGNSCTIN